jgi:hypothetical protein
MDKWNGIKFKIKPGVEKKDLTDFKTVKSLKDFFTSWDSLKGWVWKR